MRGNLSKLYLLLALMLFGGVCSVSAQVYYPDPRIRIELEKRLVEREEERRRQEDYLRRRTIAERIIRRGESNNRIYTRPFDKDLDKISVDETDVRLFQDFLSRAGTGLVRLHDLADCKRSKNQCPNSIPAKGSSYSFPQLNYVEKSYGDILFENSSFQLSGINTLGFLTDLGDLPLESLSLTSHGIKEMAEFEPSDKIDVVEAQFSIAKKGFQVGKFIYKTSLPLKQNSTYAFRSILYRISSKSTGSILSGNAEKTEGADKPPSNRKDMIMIFRVIRKHEDGSISLLWKELQFKDSPTIEIEESK